MRGVMMTSLWIFVMPLFYGGMECTANYTQLRIWSSVDYTPYESAVQYSNNGSLPRFDPKGMQGLYAVTNMFVDLVGGNLKKDIPGDLIPAEDGNFGDIYSYIKHWMVFEEGIFICAGIGLGLAVVVPLFGLIFCCCRCCGRCGSHPEKFEKRSDPCQCGTLTLLFVLLCLVITFGAVCAFVTNQYMRSAAEKINSTVTDSVEDTRAYLLNAQKHSSHVLIKNFEELEEHVKETLNDTEVTSGEMFVSSLGLVGAKNLFSTADGFAKADKDILLLNASFTRLKQLEIVLRSNITTLRKMLLDVAVACQKTIGNTPENHEKCTALNPATNNFDLGAGFGGLALSDALMDFEKRLDAKVIQQIGDGRVKLRSLENMLKTELRKASESVIAKMEEARTQVLGIELNIRRQANDAQRLLGKVNLDPMFDRISEYNLYIWYLKVTVCALIMSILIMFLLGTLFGICGSRSGSLYEDPFCSKGKGSGLLMCGVGWGFFLYFFIMLAVGILFVVGTNIQLLGCDTLINPTSNNHLRVVSILLHQYGLVDKVPGDIAGKLQKCHDDQAIYDILELNTTFHVDNTMEKRLADIDLIPEVVHIVEDATRKIRETRFLTDSERDTLLELAASPAIRDFQIDPIRNQLNGENVLRGSLDEIINDTYAVERIIGTEIEHYLLKGGVIQVRRDLEHLNRSVVSEIEREKVKSSDLLDDLANVLATGNLSQKIVDFVHAAGAAEARFRDVADPVIRSIANDTLDDLHRYITQYLNYSLGEVHNNIGRCLPVSLAINSTLSVICRDVLYPFNGFWLCVGFCLLLLIPCLFVAIALSWHYRVPESYRSGSSDSDFEPHTEIDTIPLAHRRKRIAPSTSDTSVYDARARQSKATQWAFHNAFKHQPPGYYPVRKTSQNKPSAPMSDDSIYTRPPSYYYPGSNS